ncbi:hypothetical protein [Streptomyces sp. NPDC049813]|uniref:hypothetical protein n=1 Tax=Streptomyces sp. NPDC049813 TaxID=3365597 RepID=UPI00378EDAAE
MIGVDVGGLGALLGSVATYASFPVLVYIAIRGERAAREALRAQTAMDRGARGVIACHELATSAHAFAEVVRKLPSLEAGARASALDEAFGAVRTASDSVRFWCSPGTAAAGEELFRCAVRTERQALRRAVMRSALSALEEHWCPGLDGDCDGNAETCTVSRHWCAFRSCELLESWGEMDDWARFDVRAELEEILSEVRALSDDHLAELRNVLNWGTDWRNLIAREAHGERQLRDATAAFLEASRPIPTSERDRVRSAP